MSNAPLVPQPSLLARVGGLSAPVTRPLYLSTGMVLMSVKYALDALVVWSATGSVISPLVYLTPLATLRLEVLAGAPDWVAFLLVLTTLPFAWVGGTMSVRRARDAGLHPALGLLFFVPMVQYLAIVLLAVLPRSPRPGRTSAMLVGPERAVGAALVGVAGGAAMMVPLTVLSAVALGDYGAALFVGGPFMMAAVAGLLFNLRRDQGWLTTVAVGVTTQAVAGGLLLLFALEGVICLAMASPLAVVVGVLGALLGRSLARLEARRTVALPMVVLPVLTTVEPPPGDAVVHVAETVVEVDAAPEAVWDVVVAFPEIPADDTPEWFFRAGVAWPQRARIEGEGVGAVRYCEFSTGPFVEPITTWDPPHHLAFDVTESPPPMSELSPWKVVHAPHIFDGTLQSRKGEFVLESLPGGRTRLTGRTFYTLDMAPVPYWSMWSTAIIHRIHGRVLRHIGRVAEEGSPP